MAERDGNRLCTTDADPDRTTVIGKKQFPVSLACRFFGPKEIIETNLVLKRKVIRGTSKDGGFRVIGELVEVLR